MAEFYLPSKGLLYEEGPFREGVIRLRKMKGKDNQILTEGKDPTKIMEDLLSGCLEGEHTKASNLYEQDQTFALLMLRVTTYGATYPFQYVCEGCQQRQDRTIELDQLNRVDLGDMIRSIYGASLSEEDVARKARGPFVVQTQTDGKEVSVGWHWPTGKTLKKVQVRLRQLNNAKLGRRPGEGEYTFGIGSTIKEIDGQPVDFQAAVQWVANADAGALDDLRASQERHAFGMNLDLVLECDCGWSTETFVPLMSREFFRTYRNRAV